MRRLFSFFFNAETRLARGKYVVRPVTLFLCFFIMSSASFGFSLFSVFRRLKGALAFPVWDDPLEAVASPRRWLEEG